jgi:hypothetical protein
MTNSNLPDYRSLYSQFNSISKLTVEFYHSSFSPSHSHGVAFFVQVLLDSLHGKVAVVHHAGDQGGVSAGVFQDGY